MTKANFQFTKTAVMHMPVESAVKKDVLIETIAALLLFIKEQAVNDIADKLDELFGTHWGGPVAVKLVSHSHNVFTVAGVATVSVLATYEEDK